MMMHNPPPFGFLAIDVRDAMRERDFMSSKRDLPVLDAQFIGHVVADMNDLIAEFNAPSRA